VTMCRQNSVFRSHGFRCFHCILDGKDYLTYRLSAGDKMAGTVLWFIAIIDPPAVAEPTEG
jgi:hypothetical protein